MINYLDACARGFNFATRQNSNFILFKFKLLPVAKKESVMNAKSTAYNRACKDSEIYVRWKERDERVREG